MRADLGVAPLLWALATHPECSQGKPLRTEVLVGSRVWPGHPQPCCGLIPGPVCILCLLVFGLQPWRRWWTWGKRQQGRVVMLMAEGGQDTLVLEGKPFPRSGGTTSQELALGSGSWPGLPSFPLSVKLITGG